MSNDLPEVDQGQVMGKLKRRRPTDSVATTMRLDRDLSTRERMEAARVEPAAKRQKERRFSRRLHYLSTNWEVFGGVARTTADWIGGGKRRCDNDL